MAMYVSQDAHYKQQQKSKMMMSDGTGRHKGNPHPKKRLMWRQSFPLLDTSTGIHNDRRIIQSMASSSEQQQSTTVTDHHEKKTLVFEGDGFTNIPLVNPLKPRQEKPSHFPTEMPGDSYRYCSPWSENQEFDGQENDWNRSKSFEDDVNDPGKCNDVEQAEGSRSTQGSASPVVVTTTAASVLLLMRYSVTEEALQSLSCEKSKINEGPQSLEKESVVSTSCTTKIDSPLPMETSSSTSTPDKKSQDDIQPMDITISRRVSMPTEDTAAVTPSPKPKCPTRLTMPEDPNELNSLHCFVRAHLLEVFSLPSHKEEPDRVGLRCVFCAHLPRKERMGTTMCTFHPKSLNDLYRSVMTWQRLHFRVCKHVPQKLRDEYWKHKESDQTRGKTHYWAASAMRMGLKDIDSGRNGIYYVGPK